MPNKERKRKVVLRQDEYSRMLSEAGGKPRDFAILQLFLTYPCTARDIDTILINNRKK